MKHTSLSAEKFILSREFFGMKLGLENITGFLKGIGSPQHDYKSIHIAGTNGKGSTAAMLASILEAQGYKTGLFTSPHLVQFRERVRINGRMIPQSSLRAFVDRHRPELVRRKLSFFEVVTALAVEYFSRTRVDVAVIETGLGGRLDATNMLSPVLSIITGIDRDHLEILGGTLRKIAYEKAGIIKPSVPVLVGELAPSAETVIRSQCKKKKAPFRPLVRSKYVLYPEQNRLVYDCGKGSSLNLKPSLLGEHQLKNAALAANAALIVNSLGLKISKRAIKEGLASTVWPGRFQVINRRGKPDLVFDVGHNIGGVAAYVRSFQQRFPGRKTLVLTGFVKRKEHQKMFDELSKIASSYYLVPLRTQRSADHREMMDVINWRGIPVRNCGSVSSGYSQLLKVCQSDDIITVIGSHYLVGEFFSKYGIK